MPFTIEAFAEIARVTLTKRGQKNDGIKDVQAFLTRFGYLDKGSYKSGELDAETSEALTKYQKLHGIPSTGDFDISTRSQITTHRCGVPDMKSGVAFSTTCKWDKLEITYAFDAGTSQVGGAAEFQAVRDAFRTWQSVMSLSCKEVGINSNPDVRIGWRPARDADHSMVGGVLAHADFPPGCSVVTDDLPKPVHFDDTEHAWRIGAVSGAFDIETVALHELGHILGLAHSDVSGTVMWPSISTNSTNRSLTTDDISGARDLYGARHPVPMTLRHGRYTIRQKSNGRFMDAYTSGNDFSAVTRPAQNNSTQRWILSPVGGVYTVQQRSNGRFMDAHETSNDYSVVTRTAQNNDTQRWVFLHLGCNVYTVQQLSNGRFMDAHTSSNDYSAVTRTAQNNDTQHWIINPAGTSTFTIQQRSNGRFLDAHESSNDYSVVTRTAQNNNTQRWVLTPVGGVYTIQQEDNGRFLDAHEVSSEDYSTVTRTAQGNATQRWVLRDLGDSNFTIQQLSNFRFLDAHTSSNDYSVVTRTAQNNNTQRWLINPV